MRSIVVASYRPPSSCAGVPGITSTTRGGEFSAAVELRRLFPGVAGTAQARECARTIAAWKPLAVPLRPVRLPRCEKR